MSEGHHFGYLLDKGILTNSLGWRIEHSNKVMQISSGEWLLKEINGVKLGLTLKDWIRGFGQDCIINNEVVTLDISKRKEKDINLDPFIVIALEDDYANFLSDTFDNEEADSTEQPPECKVEAYTIIGGSITFIKRSAIRFDTSAYSGASSAVLWVKEIPTSVPGFEEEIERIYAFTCTLDSTITTLSNYGAIFAGLFAEGTGGTLEKFGEADVVHLASRDMTATFVAKSVFDIGFMHEDDTGTGLPDGTPNTVGFNAPIGTPNDPYLLITMPDILRYKYNNGLVDRFRRENLSGQYYKI